MNGEILLYHSDDGRLKIQVCLANDTVWLTQADMVDFFQSSKSNISEHIKYIFEEGELQEDSVVRKFRKTDEELSEVEKQFIASIEHANKELKAVKSKNKKKE